jgi:hypothetical protein
LRLRETAAKDHRGLLHALSDERGAARKSAALQPCCSNNDKTKAARASTKSSSNINIKRARSSKRKRTCFDERARQGSTLQAPNGVPCSRLVDHVELDNLVKHSWGA